MPGTPCPNSEAKIFYVVMFYEVGHSSGEPEQVFDDAQEALDRAHQIRTSGRSAESQPIFANVVNERGVTISRPPIENGI